MANVDIVERQSTLKVAPTGLWLEAIDISGFAVTPPASVADYDPTYHEITWIWRVEKSDGVGGWTADPLTLANAATLNLPDAWKDPNTRYGREIGIVLNDPGTYRVKLWAVDASGNTAEASREIEVADPDAFFAGDATLCYSPLGDFAGAPAGAATTTDLLAVSSFLNDNGQFGADRPTRILFRRGETFEDFHLLDRASNGLGSGAGLTRYAHNLRLGAFGTGNTPKLTFTAAYDETERNILKTNSNTFVAPEVVIHDLDFEATWDQARWTGETANPFPIGSAGANCFLLYHRLKMRGLGGIAFVGGGAGEKNATSVLSECDVTELAGYTLTDFGGDATATGTRGAIIASSLYHNPLTPAKIPGTSDQVPDMPLSPVRITGGCKRLGVDMVDTFCRWGAQNAFKHQTSGEPGVYGYFSRVAFEGGLEQFKQEQADGPETITNVVFDKALFVATSITGAHMILNNGPMTVRNVIAYVPDISGSVKGQIGFLKQSEFAGMSSPDRYDDPLRYHNITWINLRRAADNADLTQEFIASQSSPNYTNVTVENNVFYAPNDASTETTNPKPLDLSTSIAGFAPRDPGYLLAFPFVDRMIPTGGLADGASITWAWPSTADSKYPDDTDETNAWVFDAFRMSQNGDKSRRTKGVTFASAGAAGFTMTNNTGGMLAAGTYSILANRWSELPAPEASSALPATIPLPRPQDGSNAIDTGDAGLKPHDDFLGAVRPASGNERGALLEA